MEPPVTGEAVLDESLATLRDVAERPLAEQQQLLEAAHRSVQQFLAGTDELAAR